MNIVDTPKRRLSLLDCVGLTVGIIIGAGIYDFAPRVAREVGSAWAVPLVWLAGGLLVLIGAVCYAELVSAYPEAGGDYAFLTRSYGAATGFLFAWCDFWIIRPGNVAAMAYLFARFAQNVGPIPGSSQDQVIYAVIAVGGLTLVNIWGVRPGTRTQNTLTLFKLLCLVAVVIVGVTLPSSAGDVSPMEELPRYGGLGLAIVFVIYTYGGWAELSYVAAEIREPERNTWKALALGLAAVTVIYIALNGVFLRSLGYHRLCTSESVVSDMLQLRFPTLAGKFVSLLIAASTLGSINGMILTGSRIYYALGRDHAPFAWLGAWSTRRSSPVRSLIVQAMVSLAMVLWFGRARDALARLVIFTTPVYWTFFLLVIISIVLLRHREPERIRPHQTPLYPLPIVVFSLLCLYVIYSSGSYAWSQRSWEIIWLIGVAIAGLGLVGVGAIRAKRRTAHPVRTSRGPRDA